MIRLLPKIQPTTVRLDLILSLLEPIPSNSTALPMPPIKSHPAKPHTRAGSRPRPLALGFAACLALACLLLTACGGASQSPSSTKPDASTGKATDPAATSASGTSGRDQSASAPSDAAVAAVAATVPSSAPGPGSEKVVASVQNLKITLGELRHRMGSMGVRAQEAPEPPQFTACMTHEAAKAPTKSPAQLKGACRARYEELKVEALNSLIHARWLTLEAKEHGLHPDEAVLSGEVARGLKTAAAVGQTLTSTGRTLADAKYWARINQYSFLIHELIARQTPKVTPRQVAEYYAKNAKLFSSPQRRDLHLIRTDSETSARHVLKEIRSGRSFQSVVKEVSTHQPIRTEEGSTVGLAYTNYAEPHLSNAIFSARPHVLEGPVKLDASNSPKAAYGYYVFEVMNIHPASKESLAQAKASITARLPQIFHEQTLKAAVHTFRHKWRARSDCRAGYVVSNCRQYPHRAPFEDLYTL